jgi:hypothetical protein
MPKAKTIKIAYSKSHVEQESRWEQKSNCELTVRTNTCSKRPLPDAALTGCLLMNYEEFTDLKPLTMTFLRSCLSVILFKLQYVNGISN